MLASDHDRDKVLLAEKEDILAQFTTGLRKLLYHTVWQWIFSLHDIALQRNCIVRNSSTSQV